jgi:two-component system response regulator WspF
MATEILRRIVITNKDYKIIWSAKNGAEAIMYCNNEKPDLILMDLMMPVMDGVEATKRIMQSTPCAILVVTSTVTGHSSEVFSAMGAGALDVVATPVIGTNASASSGQELLRKIDMISKLIGFKYSKKTHTAAVTSLQQNDGANKSNIIALGCSTGGPHAILEILLSLPTDINATIVIIQHMDKKFVAGLTSWISQQISLPVKLIKEGDKLIKGTVMFANSHQHLFINRDATFSYSEEPLENFYHPSVDVFFKSLAINWKGGVVGALLTGMGRDGAQGLLSIKEQGWPTISQDEDSSVVYGMPKAAALLNAAKDILPLKKIGPKIVGYLK